MTVEQLRKVIEAQPFQAFVIHLADGRQIPVPSREFLLHAPNTRTFVVWRGDAYHIIDLLLVTDLEVKSPPAESGKRRKS